MEDNDLYFVGHRGSAKSNSEYLFGLKMLYEHKKINYEDYIYMLAAYKTIRLNQPEKEVLNWIEEKLGEGKKKNDEV